MVRRWSAWVPVLLLVLLVLEVAALVAVAQLVGLSWTLLLLVALSVLGGWLLRREGVRAWRRFRTAAQSGPPGRHATDGVVGLGGALLLAVPGFVTGAVGLFLLLPPVRALARRGVQRLAERRLSSAAAGDLFGPRRVKVRRGAPRSGPAPSTAGGTAAGSAPQLPVPGPAAPGPQSRPAPPSVVEGEVVD
ncbi:MAG TPA: FxsA family protein [Micromonosporaceae bacterium]|nr:FxsA family protein [Micromonosporaceae bacterium]